MRSQPKGEYLIIHRRVASSPGSLFLRIRRFIYYFEKSPIYPFGIKSALDELGDSESDQDQDGEATKAKKKHE